MQYNQLINSALEDLFANANTSTCSPVEFMQAADRGLCVVATTHESKHVYSVLDGTEELTCQVYSRLDGSLSRTEILDKDGLWRIVK